MFLWYLRELEHLGSFEIKLWCWKMPQISIDESLTQSQLRRLSKQNNRSTTQIRSSWKSIFNMKKSLKIIYRTTNVNGRPITEIDINPGLVLPKSKWHWIPKSDKSRGFWNSISRKDFNLAVNVKSKPITKIDVNTKTFTKN